MKKRNFFVLNQIAKGLILSLLPSISFALTATTTFGVSATVVSGCVVSATALAFGNYNPVSPTPTDQTSTVTVTCTNGTTYNVGLDAGQFSGATVTTRRMGPAPGLPYSLYRDSGRTLNWGNTVGTDTVSGTGTGVAQPLTVYGRIPIGSTATAQGYTDTIGVTVTY